MQSYGFVRVWIEFEVVLKWILKHNSVNVKQFNPCSCGYLMDRRRARIKIRVSRAATKIYPAAEQVSNRIKKSM